MRPHICSYDYQWPERFTEATEPEERRFAAAARRETGAVDRIERTTLNRVVQRLRQARYAINERIADASGFQVEHLTAMRGQITTVLNEFADTWNHEFLRTADAVEDAATALVTRPLGVLGFEIGAPMLPGQLMDVLVGFSANKIKGLTAEAIDKVDTLLTLAISGGQSKTAFTNSLKDLLPSPAGAGSIAARARRIIRTEINRIHSTVTHARMTQASNTVKGLRKYWLSAGDLHVRPSHVRAGQSYGPDNAILVNQPFFVGGFKAMFPRDPALPAAEVVNCRCRNIPVPPA